MWFGVEWLMRECKREQCERKEEGSLTEEMAHRFGGRADCSFRGPDFSSQHPCRASHKGL